MSERIQALGELEREPALHALALDDDRLRHERRERRCTEEPGERVDEALETIATMNVHPSGRLRRDPQAIKPALGDQCPSRGERTQM